MVNVISTKLIGNPETKLLYNFEFSPLITGVLFDTHCVLCMHLGRSFTTHPDFDIKQVSAE